MELYQERSSKVRAMRRKRQIVILLIRADEAAPISQIQECLKSMALGGGQDERTRETALDRFKGAVQVAEATYEGLTLILGGAFTGAFTYTDYTRMVSGARLRYYEEIAPPRAKNC